MIKITAFGLVSRGKSAVLNALIGEKILETGPVHGVTQWPKSLRWTPNSGKIQVELTDTPGLMKFLVMSAPEWLKKLRDKQI